MSQAPWYKRYAADFVSDPYVQAMTAEQYGWYSAALDLMWIHTPAGCLPNDKQLLSKMIGRCDEMHFSAHSQIVLDRFKVSSDCLWLYHPKMMEQIQHLAEVSEKRAEAGRKGGEKNRSKKPRSKSQAIAKQLPTDSDSDVVLDLYTAAERIYALYPRHEGRAAALQSIEKQIRKVSAAGHAQYTDKSGQITRQAIGGESQAVAFMEDSVTEFARSPAGHRGEFVPHPSTWFNQQRYTDDRQEWYRDEQPRNGNGNGSNGSRSTSAHTVRTLTNLSAAERAIQRERERAKESETDNRSH